MKLVARIEVNIRKEDVDSILFSAFNAGGISLWADKIWASGGKLGERAVSYTHLALPTTSRVELSGVGG